MPPKKDNPGSGGGGGGGKGGPKKNDTTPPSLIGPTVFSVFENTTFVADLEADETVSWSITEGGDSSLFTIASESGVLNFLDAPDYEALVEDTVYDLTIVLTDQSGNTTSESLTVTVVDIDEDPPAFQGSTALSADENTTFVADLEADETVTWGLVGSNDDRLFIIDRSTGELSFQTAPDWENPGDGDRNNVYSITVQMADLAGNTSTESLEVTVNDVDENVPPTSYKNFVVFGDSLSDNGNFAALASDFLKPGYSVPFQYEGDGSIRTYDALAFTDGTAYADTLADLLWLDAGYQNYAFGGAQALGSKLGAGYINEYSNLTYMSLAGTAATFSIVADTEAALAEYGDFDINLAAQVDRYLDPTYNPNGVAAGTLAVLNIGANDLGEFDTSFFNILLGGVNDFAADLGAEIEIEARRLSAAGVEGIALYRLPVAEFFIGYGDLNWLERPVARDLIDSVNDEISAAATALTADGITTEVVRLDIMSIDILDNMQTHGFLYQGPYLFGYSGDPAWVETAPDVIEPVFNVNATAMDYRQEQLLFFDEIHPSGALHDVLAIFSSESLTTAEAIGSGGPDTITLGSADDFVLGLLGSDVITLGAGDDVALGGLGNDTLRGNDGSDLLIGGAGNDSLEGGAGSDLLAGSAGTDHLLGGADGDILIGGVGSDIVFGDGGDDVFLFFEEMLWGGAGGSADFYYGGDGADTLLVFLASPTGSVTQDVTGSTTILTFGDGGTLTADSIETIELHMGLPEDVDSPIAGLTLSDDLWDRYDEAQLWGIA